MVDIFETPKGAGSKSGDSYEDRDSDPANLIWLAFCYYNMS